MAGIGKLANQECTVVIKPNAQCSNIVFFDIVKPGPFFNH